MPPGRRRRFERTSQEELDAQSGAELPDPEGMSVLDADVTIPLNAAIAADVLSGYSGAEPEGEAPPEPED